MLVNKKGKSGIFLMFSGVVNSNLDIANIIFSTDNEESQYQSAYNESGLNFADVRDNMYRANPVQNFVLFLKNNHAWHVRKIFFLWYNSRMLHEHTW